MTVIELAQLVKNCRDAQRIYFRDRTSHALGCSKAIEAQVDRAVRDVLGGAHAQRGLFDSSAPAGEVSP